MNARYRAEEKAKKFAARAQRMDQLRHERYGADDDDDDLSIFKELANG